MMSEANLRSSLFHGANLSASTCVRLVDYNKGNYDSFLQRIVVNDSAWKFNVEI